MKEKLIGTWRLESCEDFAEGKWIRPFGDEPKGYFSFGEEGRVSVQFMKFPKDPGGNPLESYLAYFGSFTVDEAAGTFTSLVEGSLDPELVGTHQKRSFRFIDGNLVVGDLTTYRRSFIKVKA